MKLKQPSSTRAGVPGLRILAIGLLAAAVLCGNPVRAQNSGSGKGPASVSDTVAFEMEIDALSNAFSQTAQKMEKQKKKESSAASEFLWLIAGGGLLAMVVVVRYIPGLLQVRDVTYQARLAAAKAAVQVHPQMAAEEAAFSDFAAKFSCGPATIMLEIPAPEAERSEPDWAKQKEEKAGLEFKDRGYAANSKVADPRPPLSSPSHKPAQDSAATPPSHLSVLRGLIQKLGVAADEPAKQSLLARLAQQTEALKSASESPESLPVWKVASALEALFKQLAGKPESLNPSTLRTAVAAVDLIHTLSGPGIRPDLVENPPVRVLAVDDDPISRHAISFTLKKALDLPELASNGPAGLELAMENAYDAIFLDVQMPGLNGFDLCLRIRQTALNRTTPIIFITSRADFDARAKSSVVGGQDLIVKPFLTFEVALKALTLVLQHRLKQDAPEKPAPPEEAAPEPTPEPEALAAVS